MDPLAEVRIRGEGGRERRSVPVVIASFSDASHATRMPALLSAELARSEAAIRARVHEGVVDPLLSMDLSDTTADGAGSFLTRFGLAFALGVAVGLAIDLALGMGQTGFAFTGMGAGLGALVGTMLVLSEGRTERDRAFDDVRAAVDRGDVLVSVRIDPVDRRDAAVDLLRRNGGRLVFEA